MMKIHLHCVSYLTKSCLFGAFAMLGTINLANAQEVPVPVNLPTTVTASVEPGSTSVELPFALEDVDDLVVETIAPVNGATFSLINPEGTVVLQSGQAGVETVLGVDLAPDEAPPGSLFTTQDINSPENGTWIVRVDYPAAQEQTVIVVTIFASTSIQAGIALERDTYLAGEEVSIGILLIDEGRPILDLSPTITISTEDSGIVLETLQGQDNGLDPDRVADDGVYSVGYVFPEAGQYLIEGQANVQSSQGSASRSASRIVSITEPSLEIDDITSNLLLGQGQCVEAVEITIDSSVLTAGEYIVQGTLQSSNGATTSARNRATLAPGARQLKVLFSGDDIVANLQVDGPYTLSALDVLSFSDEGFVLASRRVDALETPSTAIDSFCKEPIVVAEFLSVETDIQDNYISALNFTANVEVQQSGSYQMSFKIIGSAGEDVDLVAFTRSLSQGSNDVEFSVSADKFQAADGPYGVISALVLGQGNTAQLAFVGESPIFERWQFTPLLIGDLDNDGDVDAEDRNVVINARNTDALSPGDRRDIVRDGRIDIRDIRAISLIR